MTESNIIELNGKKYKLVEIEECTTTGDRNTGFWNTGDWNTGNSNTGDRNTGDRNTGWRNTGNRNTGKWNTGYWNTGNSHTGFLNTEDAKLCYIFDKLYPIEIIKDFSFPDYFYFDLTEWISEEDMTEEEKEAHPTYKTTWGYLKAYDYKEAWRKSWDEAALEDKKKTLTIPNWNNEKFKQISGIDVEKELENDI